MLPAVQVAPNSTTVSGYSYGGDMAVQVHVAFSKTIKGVCGFAAQPVYCAATLFTREEAVWSWSDEGKGARCDPGAPPCVVPGRTVRFDHCRATPEVVDVGRLPDWPRRNCGHPFRPGCLDDVVNMYESRVFLHSAANDSLTPAAAVANTVNWYSTMLSKPQRDLAYDLGPTATSRSSDPKGDCLAHVYPRRAPLRPPASAIDEASLFPFDQAGFGADPKHGWAKQGLVYAPAACRRNATAAAATPGHPAAAAAAACALHLHLHDCGTRAAPSLPPAGALSAEEERWAAYAESNDVVLLLPRLQAGSYGSHALDVNRGCWDVFGQFGTCSLKKGCDFAHQTAPHLAPLLPMLRALLGANAATEEAREVEAADAEATTSEAVVEATKGAAAEAAAAPAAAPAAGAAGLPFGIKALPQLRIDPARIAAQGGSSGGDMAVQWQLGFSRHVRGICGFDAQPWRCAATRFDADALLPQSRSSSVPHCLGCPAGKTIEYDHCKSHADFVNTSALAAAARAVPVCAAAGTADCIDDPSYLRGSRVFLVRGECRTYTGPAVANTRDVYAKLGAPNVTYFDQCEPDGSHKPNDTTAMCLEAVFGPSNASEAEAGAPPQLRNFLFPQAPFVTDANVGFGAFGFMYLPEACEDKSVACGLQVRFHGCGEASAPDLQTQRYAEANHLVILSPNVPGHLPWNANGNNASEHCNAGTEVAGNCKEISRGCWDGYGQLSSTYYLQSAAHMQTVWRMVQHLSSHAL